MDRLLTTTFYFAADLCMQVHFLPYEGEGAMRLRHTFGDILTPPLSYSNNKDRFLTELVDLFRTDYYYAVTNEGFQEAIADREYLLALFESTFDQEVVVSHSPISGEVLQTLLNTADWIRAHDGLVAFTSIGAIILVPAKLALRGLGDGLRDGLHYRVRRWFGVPDSWKAETERAALSGKSEEPSIPGILEAPTKEKPEGLDKDD